jgi:CRP-like cAMP-binding protein
MTVPEWELLRALDPEDRAQVLASLRRRRFAAGEAVFHDGDRADALHLVAEGRLVVRRTTEDGDRVAFSVLGPGSAFGELAMLTPERRRSSTVEALEPCLTLALSYADFDRLCATHPGVTRLLLGLLAERVTRLSDHLVESRHVSADRRVARRLLDLHAVYASGPAPTSGVALSVTQTDLADLAGASRSTTNRVLRRIEALGGLTLARGRIVVRDVETVRRAAALPAPARSPRTQPEPAQAQPTQVRAVGRASSRSDGMERPHRSQVP